MAWGALLAGVGRGRRSKVIASSLNRMALASFSALLSSFAQHEARFGGPDTPYVLYLCLPRAPGAGQGCMKPSCEPHEPVQPAYPSISQELALAPEVQKSGLGSLLSVL